jgi:hypothetical protein
MSESTLRSRRALLTGAGAAAAAVAANAVVSATPALGAASENVVLGAANSSGTAQTTWQGDVTGDPALIVTNTSVDTLNPASVGLAGAATNEAGRGLLGLAPVTGTGVFGIADATDAQADIDGWDTSYTGVYGWCPTGTETLWGSGVWGDSNDVGVYGTGWIGVYGDGGSDGTGIEAYSGTGYGLYVTGKVKFANRSGKFSVAKGKSSVSKSVTGMTSSNIVIAVLQTPESGTWVRAAVAASGKFTVYFNRALPSSSSVGWIVLG